MNEDRILTRHGQFERAPWDGTNRSGINPVCDKVVVRVDKAVTQTTGGIYITDDKADEQTMGATSGVIVAVGPMAFFWDTDRTHKWGGEKPKPGDRVLFTRYAGQEYNGLDGEMYRLMQDRVIGGTQGVAEIATEEPAGANSNIIFGNSDDAEAEAA